MKLMSVILFLPCLLLVSGNAVFAEPYLQLDANPATYLSAPEESIFATETEFTLYALVNSNKGSIDGSFYLSAALVPTMDYTEPPPDLGSFTFDGMLINAVSDMEYGSPPLNTILNKDQIAAHGIYDTYYEEFGFVLGPEYENATLYNSMITPGGPNLCADGPLYYRAFEVDVSALASEYAIHFDLYTKSPEGSMSQFAPFSHDLVTTPIPPSVILGLLGIGVAGLKLRKYA
jgi:hypothetical protein